MNKISYCKIYKDGYGLCNQIFSLVNSIIFAYINKKKIIIVNDFLVDYSKNDTRFFSEVFDIVKLNTFLKENYDMNIFDKNTLRFQIQEVKYGMHNQTIDITEEIVNNYCGNNTVYIDTNVNLNTLAKGDPLPNMLKNVYVRYSINDISFCEEYNEKYCFLANKIMFDLSNTPFQHIFGWITTFNHAMFDNILRNLCITPYFIEKTYSFMLTKQLHINKKINIIHARLEHDAINHWSKMNNMTPAHFHTVLADKYIRIIQKYVNKTDENIILSYSTDNTVVSYLQNNGYTCHFTDKTDQGREINALTDFNIGKLCNNLFIGNFNMERLSGSTLSYCLINYFNKKVKLALVDLDNIRQHEKKYY